MKKHLLLFGLGLALTSLVVDINATIQLYFLLVALLLTGVPHGSLDYFVEAQTLKGLNQEISIRSFLTKYLLNMIVYGIFWFLFPTAALIVFIGLTAFHFGEIDWPVRKKSTLDAVLYTVYGLQMIVFIITSHIQEAAPILEIIVRNTIPFSTWIEVSKTVFILCSASLLVNALLLLVVYKQLGWDKTMLGAFFAQSLFLFVLVYQLPLYLSFGFYFGFWHSGLSFNLIRKQLNLTDTWNGWMHLIKKAIPYTMVAWLGLAALILITFHTNTQLFLITNLFVGIALLSLPHLQVFTKIKAQ
ncbi:Brp/Blh family beta-carotene 15,15'-dioxygenase [soil metagenome]